MPPQVLRKCHPCLHNCVNIVTLLAMAQWCCRDGLELPIKLWATGRMEYAWQIYPDLQPQDGPVDHADSLRACPQALRALIGSVVSSQLS